jgi:hypothetical protein
MLTRRTGRITLTAEVIVPDGGTEGVVIAQGRGVRRLGAVRQGWQTVYCYNLLGLRRDKVVR